MTSFDNSVLMDSDSLSTNNDIIANSQPLDLSATNPNILVQAEFVQRFEDRDNTADATEDVDMFSVELTAGDTITIDADSVRYKFEGFSTGPGPDIRIFDAAGEPIVIGTDEEGEPLFAESRQDAAPDEAFIAGRDAYLEFTAPESGTYYIGSSFDRNNIYDPNEVGSGSGAIFSPRFGIGPGPYTLEVELNPEGFDGEVYEAFDGTPVEGSPVVSFTTTTGTFARGDVIVSSQLLESEPNTIGILDFIFNVEGEIPEGGLEVFLESDTDMTSYFEGLASNPRVAVGGEITGGLYNTGGELIGFKALLTANNARFPYNAADRQDDDPNAPETINFSLASGPAYQVNSTTSASAVTFFDDLAQVQSGGGPVPEVSISIDNSELIESEGTEVTLSINVTGEIPADGLLVAIDSGEGGFLGEFDVFNAEVTGGPFPAPNGSASGFFFRVFENEASIKLQVFDETTNDQIPPEDALEGVEEFTLSVLPNEAYTVSATSSSVDLTIKDNPDSVPLPEDDDDGDDGGDDGGNDDDDDTEGVVTDNDGRSSIDDTIAEAVPTGLSSDNPNVMVEGSINVRWRNSDPEQRADNTEDVDIFSFELSAGDTVNIDAESVPFELDGITQETSPMLRLFDEAGEELAISDGDVEFTAEAAGTYYVGVSQFMNDNYDPNISASGDGVQLVEEGISPGEYTLDIALDSEPPTTPVVSFSTTPDIISEAEGTSLVLDFSVDGEIPEGGITVNLEGDTPEILQQFLAPDGDGAVQTRVTAEGNVLYRFDTSFEADNSNFGNIEGGILEVFALEDGDPAEDNSDPAAAGTGFLSDFSFTITEPTASITLPVLDDLIAEPDQTFTYTLVDGDGYEVDGETNSGTFTVTDGVDDGVGPVVGVTAEPTTLIESDQTRIELEFTADGEIPAEGLVVVLEGDAVRAIAEFDVTASNPRDPEDEITIEGPIITGGNIVGTDETASALVFRMTENTATLNVAVFEDIVPEGTETINFTLLNGEEYEVNADASSVTVTIEDGGIIGTVDADTIVGDDMDNGIDAMAGNDTVAGGLGDDVILGNDGDDVLRGDANSRASSTGMGGDDVIFGGAGNDRIGGKDGNDLLSGDEGDDVIFGDAGDDTIMGVTGNDILTGDDFSGGSGSDLFVFGNGDGTDTITDFDPSEDLIGLVEGELTFEALEIIEINGDAAISVMETGETLAVLNGVDADELTADMFVITPDVSSLNDLI